MVCRIFTPWAGCDCVVAWFWLTTFPSWDRRKLTLLINFDWLFSKPAFSLLSEPLLCRACRFCSRLSLSFLFEVEHWPALFCCFLFELESTLNSIIEFSAAYSDFLATLITLSGLGTTHGGLPGPKCQESVPGCYPRRPPRTKMPRIRAWVLPTEACQDGNAGELVPANIGCPRNNSRFTKCGHADPAPRAVQGIWAWKICQNIRPLFTPIGLLGPSKSDCCAHVL